MFLSLFVFFVFFLLPVIQFFDTARVDRTRSWLYAASSVSYLGAMVSSNSALQFVNYPTQVSPWGREAGWRDNCLRKPEGSPLRQLVWTQGQQPWEA